MLTGVRTAGKPIGENLAPNPDFNEGESGKMPKDWNFQIRPKDAKAALLVAVSQRILRIDAAFDATKKRDNYPIVVSRDIELKPGSQYVLRARMHTDLTEEGKAALQIQYYLPPKDGKPAHFWSSSPSSARVGIDWKDFEFVFAIPRQGEKGWHPEMKKFRIRLDWPEKSGALFAAGITLQETEPRDEWQSWQELGGDRHSLIADPKFLAPEKDYYRLAPDSPAFKLGFQQIPTEKIGPYASPERATWPIVEAEGAREHPLSQ